MGPGQHRRIVAIGVDDIFDDIVTGRADDMNEQGAGEFVEAESPANLVTVDRVAATRRGQRLFPFGDGVAAFIVEAQPDPCMGRAVTKPVIGRRNARVMSAGVPEEAQIGREIERIEIAPPVGQHRVGQATFVEARHFCAGGKQVADLIDQAAGIERGNEDGRRAAFPDLGYRRGALAQHALADGVDILNKDAGTVPAVDVIDRREALGLAQRIVDRDRPGCGKPRHEQFDPFRCERVCERLVQRVATAHIAEGFDLERHVFLRPPRRLAPAPDAGRDWNWIIVG